MHTHPKFLAYYIDAAQVKLTSPAGKETVKNIPTGKLLWFPDETSHALEVNGTADQHVLVIEWKEITHGKIGATNTLRRVILDPAFYLTSQACCDT